MIPERQAGDFLRFLALMLPDDRTFRGPVADNPDALDMFFRSAAKTYLRLAIAALELGFGAEHARRYLGESARAWIEYARRVPGAISPSDVERALAAAGVCDRAACERFAAAYLATPAGRGEVIDIRHWWHLADAMTRHYAGDPPGVVAAMAALKKLGPFKLGPHGVSWWSAVVALAEECLLAKRPDPTPLLARVADENAKQFARAWSSDLATDAFFADRALGHACIARDRGWKVPEADPHPTVPLALLRLPPAPVPERDLHDWPRPDPALAAAIAEAGATKHAPKGKPAPAPPAPKATAKPGPRTVAKPKAASKPRPTPATEAKKNAKPKPQAAAKRRTNAKSKAAPQPGARRKG